MNRDYRRVLLLGIFAICGSIFGYSIILNKVYADAPSRRELYNKMLMLTESQQEPNYNYQETYERLRQRQITTANVCSELGTSLKTQSRQLKLYNESILYCRVHKCASTFILMSLQYIFSSSADISNYHRPSSWLRHVDLNDNTLKKKGNDLVSFYFTREPYRRLFSVYANKFYLPKPHWAPLAPQVIRRYRKNASPDSLRYGHDLTFLELVTYFVDEFERGVKLDIHLAPQYHACNPCAFNYTVVGRLETLSSDWQYVLTTLKTKGLVNRTTTDASTDAVQNTESQTSAVKQLYLTIPIVKGSNISVHKLYQRAWSYYHIAGHVSKNIAMPFAPTAAVESIINEGLFKSSIRTAKAASKTQGQDEAIRNQRDEALMQAYATIPRDLLERLRKVILLDCKLFGYDDRPDLIFNAPSYVDNLDHNYFEGL